MKSPRAQEFETRLGALIVGQERAVRRISGLYQIYLAGMQNPGRPIGTMLFLGPTGSGKTRVVEAAAEVLFADANAVVKIDCAEFQHSHEIAKLIGSPPGYLGHRETHPLLSQETLNQYHTDSVKISFVLFDEIEKASDALWNLLLGILDKATLTLGDNRRVDFSRAMVFMTSNLGAAEMSAILSPKLGFGIRSETAAPALDERLSGKVRRAGTEAARRKFTPEFVNRIDKIVVFKPLGEAELRRILEIELGMVQERIFSAADPDRHFVFSLTPQAKDYLLAEGTDMKYGARHLKRAIERLLVQPLSNLIATEQVRGGDLIRVDYDPEPGCLTFVKEAVGLEFQHMAEIAEVGAGLLQRAAFAAASPRERRSVARSSQKG